LLAIFIFSRQKSAKQVARLSLAPGLFNINEPVIFGLPIVFNLPLMIPFVLLPAIGIYFAWLCTTLGLMSRCVVMIPWTTPPILSAWLATAGTGGQWWCSWQSLYLVYSSTCLSSKLPREWH
jgi:PTS system cellobiose-specific IIC component